MLRNKLLAVAALIAGLLLPAQAMAAYEAYTRADLNLRVGPDTTYGIIDVIPYGEPVLVLGCLEDWYWCDVEWFGLRGWVAAEYLVQPGTSVYLPQVAPRLALPVVVFSFHSYHDRHYRERPWYKKRHGRWRGRDWRRDRRDRDRPRHERRRDRRDADRPRVRRDADRPRQGERIQRRGPDREIQRQRQRSEQRRERQRSEQRRERRRDVERSQQRQRIQQRQDRPRAEQSPRRQRSEQRRDRPRAEQRQQRQQASQPRRGERTQRRGSSRGESRSRGRSRSGSGEELLFDRGQ